MLDVHTSIVPKVLRIIFFFRKGQAIIKLIVLCLRSRLHSQSCTCWKHWGTRFLMETLILASFKIA